jgi:hypothetical protein
MAMQLRTITFISHTLAPWRLEVRRHMSFLLCAPRPLTHAPLSGLYARAKEALGQVAAEEEEQAGAAALCRAYIALR